jgi:hypothetical protein
MRCGVTKLRVIFGQRHVSLRGEERLASGTPGTLLLAPYDSVQSTVRYKTDHIHKLDYIYITLSLTYGV